MKGDFSRDTFDHLRHFSRVLMQQGRVQLDADFNEQVSILLHYMRTVVKDIIGPYGGPLSDEDCGFEIIIEDNALKIGPGRYYVGGMLCENDSLLAYLDQEGFNGAPALAGTKNFYVYLDVWERHITCTQDDAIREKGLGGPDTCNRAQVVWQVKIEDIANTTNPPAAPSCGDLDIWLRTLLRRSKAQMRARIRPEQEVPDACSAPPESRYRGLENQLYRIEIHRGGSAWDGTTDNNGNPEGNAIQAATFKWSRDNGSIVFPIVKQEGAVVTVQSLGRDEKTSLNIGDWVEIMDDARELCGRETWGQIGIMAQVDKVDPTEMTVTLKKPDDADDNFPWPEYDENSTIHPLLRKWDHYSKAGVVLSQGAILISESYDLDTGWIEIEDGIEVQFNPSGAGMFPRPYRTGDYWLVPARTATGKIEWPTDNDGWSNPHGVMHYYAPLAIVQNGQVGPRCRCRFEPRVQLPCTEETA